MIMQIADVLPKKSLDSPKIEAKENTKASNIIIIIIIGLRFLSLIMFDK